MTETDIDFRVSIFIELPKIIDNTLSLTNLEKVNELLLDGFKLIRVDQSILDTDKIGLNFSLVKDKQTQHPQAIYRG